MPVLAHTGTRVAPGDALFASPAAALQPSLRDAGDGVGEEATEDVTPGEGCVVQYVERSAPATAAAAAQAVAERRIVATRHGLAQWDGGLVSVFAAATRGPALGDGLTPSAAASAAAQPSVLGPRPGDTVHVRITRLNRLFAFGEIIAVNWRWCSHRSLGAAAAGGGGGGGGGVFKGVLRQEDIRPFKPTKDQLTPPPPSLAFGLGDVVLAEVLSQSDAHQCQLSTIAEGCGVVESWVGAAEGQYGGQEKAKLQHIPGRRDAMMLPGTGEVVPRWCPLLP